MIPEDTDLERRVLAHEQILQSLLAELGERHPELLKAITERFSPSRRGAHEQDFTETADYAEAFVHEVNRLRNAPAQRASPERKGAREEAFDRQPLSRLDGTIQIAGAKLHGVWHVSRDGTFVGDYFERNAALCAAIALAHEVQRRGGTAAVNLDGVTIDVPALPTDDPRPGSMASDPAPSLQPDPNGR